MNNGHIKSYIQAIRVLSSRNVAHRQVAGDAILLIKKIFPHKSRKYFMNTDKFHFTKYCKYKENRSEKDNLSSLNI